MCLPAYLQFSMTSACRYFFNWLRCQCINAPILRHQSNVSLIFPQRICKTVGIIGDSIAWPPHVSVYIWISPHQFHLSWQLIFKLSGDFTAFHFYSLSNIFTYVLILYVIIFTPPINQSVKICFRMANIQIKLRNIIIYPIVFNPELYISILVIIILNSWLCLRACWIICNVAPDSKGTDSEFYPRLLPKSSPTSASA